MKKIIITILVVCLLAVCLTACGKKENPSNTGSQSDTGSSINNNEVTNKEGYKVKINNDTFVFPCDYKKIKNAGFAMNSDDESKVLNSTSDYEFVNVIENDQQAFGIYIAKDGSDINKAQVLGVILRNITENVYSVEGLEIGKATVKDAVNALGKPEEPEEYDESAYILAFTYNNRKLTLNFVDGILDAAYVLEEVK